MFMVVYSSPAFLIGAACAYKRKPDNTSNNEELNI